VGLYPREISHIGLEDWLELCKLIAPFVDDGGALEYLDGGWNHLRFFSASRSSARKLFLPAKSSHFTKLSP